MSAVIKACRACGSPNLETVLSLGWLPHANRYLPIGDSSTPLEYQPHDMLWCQACGLAQLGISPPSADVFGEDYPYRSSVTRALRDNFACLYAEVMRIMPLNPDDLVVDIGGNDGNLLSHFAAHRRLNVTPENVGELSREDGCRWIQDYWGMVAAEKIAGMGTAKLITATNVFAHISDPGAFVRAVDIALAPGGMFVFEVQYLPDLLRGVQFDHVYTEHQIWWHLAPLRRLLGVNGFTIIGACAISTHGGSIRVYAMRAGEALKPHEVLLHDPIYQDSVTLDDFATFRERVAKHRHDLRRVLGECRALGLKVAGLGAPSRASTLVSYCGLSADDLDCVYEAPGSHKLGKYMPGARIEIRPEPEVFSDGYPDVLLLLSHHVGHELSEAVKLKGYRGKFIWPLPEVRVE